MTRAIFLGTFNPPHNGHINCVKSVIRSGILSKLNIEKIHIIPCYQNPNKNFGIPFRHRYNMCVREFKGLLSNMCLIDDVEETLQPKYTFSLLEYFHSNSDEYIKDGFWWIITVETYKELLDNKWKNSEDLLMNNNFIIVVPEDVSNEEYESLKHTKYYDENRCQFVDLINDPIASKHSTQLREMIKNGESVYSYINLSTQDYIKQNNLYK